MLDTIRTALKQGHQLTAAEIRIAIEAGHAELVTARSQSATLE